MKRIKKKKTTSRVILATAFMIGPGNAVTEVDPHFRPPDRKSIVVVQAILADGRGVQIVRKFKK